MTNGPCQVVYWVAGWMIGIGIAGAGSAVPEADILAIPEAKDDALIYSPATEAVLTLKTANRSDRDVRCKNVMVAAIPRRQADTPCVYAVNLDPEQSVTADLLLWDETWDWTKARDVFAAKDLKITKDAEGFLSCSITLKPGEGKLIETDAAVAKKK